MQFLKCLTKELKIARNCSVKQVNKKFKSNNLELSNGVKNKNEIEHPID